MLGKTYTEFTLTRVSLKKRDDMEQALFKIQTEGLPDKIINQVNTNLLDWAEQEKALNGILSLILNILRTVAISAVSDSVHDDFRAKMNEYVYAIVADPQEAEMAIAYIEMHQ